MYKAIMLTLLVSVGVCAPAYCDTKALELIQVHSLGGGQKLYLSKSAVRVEYENTGVVFLIREPFKDMCVMNLKKRIYTNNSLKRSQGKLFGMSVFYNATDPMGEVEYGKPKETVLTGLKANLYTKRSRNKKSWRNYWALKEKIVPDSVSKLICSYVGMPDQFGIPLKMDQHLTGDATYMPIADGDGSESNTPFNTISWRYVNLPDERFTRPAGFKLTDRPSDVMTGSVTWGSYTEMVKSPDFLFQSSSKKLNGPAKDNIKSKEKEKEKEKAKSKSKSKP